MKKFSLLGTVVAVAMTVTAVAANAVTTVIDFNSQTSNNVASLTISGVTFTADGGGVVSTTGFGNTPNGTVGIIATSGGFVPTRATIAGGTTAVSVDIGDYNGDNDSLFLRLYDSSDVLLATDTDFIPASFTGLVTLSASAVGTAYVVFGGVGALGQSNVYGDNFTFEAAAVPEPATWAMMIGGLGACGVALRRRRTLAAA